jgi:hypothetical protein
MKRLRVVGLASPRRYSYGSTAAIVTSVGLIVGFGAALVPRSAVVSGLLIISVADNISDSLSIHIYQESGKLEASAALRGTLTNFAARFLVVLSFVGIVLMFPRRTAQVRRKRLACRLRETMGMFIQKQP